MNTVQGGVGNVTSGTGIVQIATRKISKNAQTNIQTRVARNGKVASLSSLTLLGHATVHLATGSLLTQSPCQGTPPAGGTALDVQAEGPEESGVSGKILAVDPGSPGDPLAVPPVPPTPATVTIRPKDGGLGVTVNVTPDTLIEVGGAPATTADLAVAMFVEAENDPVTFNAFRIEAENEGKDAEVEGVITAVDTPLAGTVTIQDSNLKLVTLCVDASTKIERNDAPAILSDLQVGDPVSAEYNALTMVAKEIEAGTEPEPEPAPELTGD